mgnify:FL=1
MECGYQPFNWQTSDAQTDSAVEISGGGGYCDGYDVMMSQAIADELGQKFRSEENFMGWSAACFGFWRN